MAGFAAGGNRFGPIQGLQIRGTLEWAKQPSAGKPHAKMLRLPFRPKRSGQMANELLRGCGQGNPVSRAKGSCVQGGGETRFGTRHAR